MLNAGTFFLQCPDLLVQPLRLGPLLVKNEEAVGTENHVVPDQAEQRGHGNGGQLAARPGSPLNPALYEVFQMLDQLKIQFLASAARFFKSAADLASEYARTTGSVPERR